MRLLEFTMTGTKHSQAYATHKHDIAEGDELELSIDAGNQYDRDAIKVLWNGEHIGWVPKKLAEAKSMLARLYENAEDLGFEMLITVDSHEVDNPVDMQLRVVVDVEGVLE